MGLSLFEQHTLSLFEAAGTSGNEAPFWFYQDNVPASQSAVALTNLGDAARTWYPAKGAGSIVAIAVQSNAARSAGTLTVDATIDGAVTGFQAILNGTNTTTKVTTQEAGITTHTSGQKLGVKITTDGSWAPTTADITVSVTVRYS